MATKQNPNVMKLYNQLQAQRAQLGAMGGKVPSHGHPSILGRVFDILSRPDYAVMSAINKGYRTEHGLDTGKKQGGFSPAVFGAMGSGFVQGLTGKSKERGADILGSMSQAMPNNP